MISKIDFWGLSQAAIVEQLDRQELIHYTTISKYELDRNEPLLAILRAYVTVV